MSKNMFTIYHNPRCSKSRETLALLESKTNDFTIVEYLKTPLSFDEISALTKKLKVRPLEMMRTKEAEFKEQNLADASDSELIDAMVKTPKLIERPIVVNGDKAIIGRPPENVLSLFS
ncbi:arsenate reductase (glutaredoxin) [Thalassotalea ganghwensis]